MPWHIITNLYDTISKTEKSRFNPKSLAKYPTSVGYGLSNIETEGKRDGGSFFEARLADAQLSIEVEAIQALLPKEKVQGHKDPTETKCHEK